MTLTQGQGHTKSCPVPSTLCNICTCEVCSCYVQQFRVICIYKKINNLTFDLEVKVTQNVAQYPLHHVLYASAKFEAAMYNGLREDTITRNGVDKQTDGRTDGLTSVRNEYTLFFIINMLFSLSRYHISTKTCHIYPVDLSQISRKFKSVNIAISYL